MKMFGFCTLVNRDLIGRADKLCGTIYAKKIIRILTLSFCMTKCYNIGKMLFSFYVNLDNACTDITLEIHENCT